MFLSEWREFLSAPCLAGKKNFVAARVPILLKSLVPNMLPSLFPSWSGYRLISKPVLKVDNKLAMFVLSAALVLAVTGRC